MVSGRSYGQYCGLAQALDLVGERWTLLVVRDLALGPKRFGDLQAGLPGIGTSLLSERLRRLEELEVTERAVAARPARGVLYRLTARGEDLARAIAPLTAWGATYLGQSLDQEFRPDWLAFTLRSAFRAEAAAGVKDCYELRLGPGVVLWVTVDDGRLAISQERPRRPDFVVEADVATLAQLGAGLLDPDDAVESGRAKFEGDAGAGWRLLRLFGTAAPALSGAER